MLYLFYAKRSNSNSPLEIGTLDNRYSYVIWQPNGLSTVPAGISKVPLSAWWLFHHVGVFSNRDYAMMVIYHGEHVIHRSGVFPKYFRFPFMAQDDLQIGDTWTHPDYRGKGLATFAVNKIVEAMKQPARTFWYVVEFNNFASIHVVEKAGFQLVGEGTRTKRIGIKALGSFIIQSTSQYQG